MAKSIVESWKGWVSTLVAKVVREPEPEITVGAVGRLNRRELLELARRAHPNASPDVARVIAQYSEDELRRFLIEGRIRLLLEREEAVEDIVAGVGVTVGTVLRLASLRAMDRRQADDEAAALERSGRDGW